MSDRFNPDVLAFIKAQGMFNEPPGRLAKTSVVPAGEPTVLYASKARLI